MSIVKMAYHSPILVESSPSKCFIKSRVDASKRNRARGGKAVTIVVTQRAEFRKVDRNTSTITESVGNKTPGGFNALGTLHAVFYYKDGATDGKARFRIVDPRLNATGPGDSFREVSQVSKVGHTRSSRIGG
jgi:hypothetical protein